MPHNILFGQPVGTRFYDRTLDRVYEIVEVPADGYTYLHSNRRGRAVDSPDQTPYVLGSWWEDEVEITSWPSEPSLYEKVEALEPGAIFRVGAGDPWIRTRKGVQSLYGVRDGLAYTNHTIPEGWKTYEIRTISVLWDPTGVN
jgi:heme-degrading monooxygenase HmoA